MALFRVLRALGLSALLVSLLLFADLESRTASVLLVAFIVIALAIAASIVWSRRRPKKTPKNTATRVGEFIGDLLGYVITIGFVLGLLGTVGYLVTYPRERDRLHQLFWNLLNPSSPTPPAPIDPTPSLAGAWSGIVTQVRPSDRYPVAMTIREGGGGQIDYRSLNCGGVVSFVGVEGDTFIYHERITYGSCIDNGTIHVRLIPNGVDWLWTYSGSTAVHGTLHRQ